MFEGEHDLEDAGDTRGGLQVADVGLGRADQQRAPGVPALTEDGRILTIALVNRHPEESAQITLNLKGWKVQSKVEKAAIVGESYLAANVPGRPEQVKIQKEEIELDPSNPVVEIPAHGVVIFRIKGR